MHVEDEPERLRWRGLGVRIVFSLRFFSLFFFLFFCVSLSSSFAFSFLFSFRCSLATARLLASSALLFSPSSSSSPRLSAAGAYRSYFLFGYISHFFFRVLRNGRNWDESFQEMVPGWCGRCGPGRFGNWEAILILIYFRDEDGGDVHVLSRVSGRGV